MGGASNRSDDSGGGTSYSDQLKKSQKNPIQRIIDSSPVINVVKNIAKRGNKFNQDFFNKKVAPTKPNLNYKEYMKNRVAGKTDAYGNTINQNPGGGSDNNPILSTNTEATKQVASSGIVTNNGIVAPTTAEVSQATSTMMSDAEISVANKKKGRSTTILNRATGLGNSSLNTTKKTLGA